jgi:protein-tyrosine phosphatase
MFKSLFGGGKSPAAPDLSFLSVDMHSHLLPGLDDGLQTMDQTIDFMWQLKEMGYKKLICTPHILSDMHPNTPETILPRLEMVREAVEKAGIGIKVDAAAEYMIDLEFEQLINSGKQLLTFGMRDYILIEMSYVAPSPNYEKIIFDLQMKGLKPIFAHPERYNYFHNEFGKYQRLIDLGCDLQVNILSLSGFYGKEVKRAGEALIKKGMVSFLGTDMHHHRHLALLKEFAVKKDFLSLASSGAMLNKTLL